MLRGPELADRVTGCLLGGAVGDALGAPFEGLWARDIPAPADLLAGFAEFEGYPRGQYTDDTQLTVATLRSVVRRGRLEPADVARAIAKLWRSAAVVGPGGACTAAADNLLRGGHWTTSGAAPGQAGNGAAMRTAAVGLYFLHRPADLPAAVADISRITHRDPRSIAGGVAVAEAARLLAVQPDVCPADLAAAVAAVVRDFDAGFAAAISELPARLADEPAAVRHFLAWSGGRCPEFAEPIVTPFVVPTVLASLWAVMAHPADWSAAVAAVIGLGGDVDTLGAIVGGLMGARCGLAAVPADLRARVLHARGLRVLALRYAGVIAAE